MTDRRSYGQFCGFAAALDILGDRWTLLIVRELVLAPRRFNELAANLPGIGPNLLSERLKSLTDCGVIERTTVPGDARGRVYTLGEAGLPLRGLVMELAKWGMQFMTPELAEGEARADWCFLAIRSMIDPAAVPDRDESYEFHVDDEVFTIAVLDGTVTASRGTCERPVLRITTDARTFIEIGARLSTPFEAAVSGRLVMTGDLDAVNRCDALLGLSDARGPARRDRPVTPVTAHRPPARRGRPAKLAPAAR